MTTTSDNRRARLLRMLTYARQDVTRDGLFSTKTPVSCFWWDMHPNFGDEFTPFLLPRYGFMPLLRPPNEAHVFGVGSIIDMSPSDTRAIFWGSGKMHKERASSRPNATILALRGHLSREAMGIDDTIALGDPGLLAPRWIPRARVRDRVGVVFHYSHANHNFARKLKERLRAEAHYIDPSRPLQSVVTEISSCTAILTTSLHGLVVADAYGVPAAWALPEPTLPGGSFKFEDYESVVEPTHHRRVSIDEIRSVEHVRRASMHVSHSAVRRSAIALEDSLSGLHDFTSLKAPTVSRLWQQYRYLIP